MTVSSRTLEMAASPLTAVTALSAAVSISRSSFVVSVSVLGIEGPGQALLHGRLHEAHVAQRNIGLVSDFGEDYGVQALAGEPGGDVEDPGVAETLPGQGGRRGHRWKF